ncbi:MAG TPA: type II toxin-antitoxin system VapC family toxin [Caulobacteraceae bacterium]|nr:type II toxin-antitoxin system VapC family toxin [Caulobacteraceae bacterium]
MTKLLDTNVVSEIRRPAPDQSVLRWLGTIGYRDAYLSVVSVSEIRLGIERLPDGRRRALLEHWLEHEIADDFGDRLLPINEAVADRCGVIRARALIAGRPMSIMDAFIAATADVHGLTLVTRNVRDFEVWGGPIFNPWAD